MGTKFSGKVVVVTGASAGVGRAVVQAFAREGASVGLIARGSAGLAAAERDVVQAGGRALVLPLDVADAEAVEHSAAQVESELGPIDVWVNAAMVSVYSPVQHMTADEYRRVTEVTYLGTVHGTLAALRRMVPRNRGAIVQVGSALAYRGIPYQSGYCAAKHAVQGFCDSLRSELLHDGSAVTLSMVQLPGLNTPQFSWTKNRFPNKPQPVPPIYQPEVAARAVLWAAERGQREVVVGGMSLVSIVGDKIAPGIGDRYLAKTGFESQQTDQPRDPEQNGNLWEPLDEDRDFGAHGPFDERASRHSPQLWAVMNRTRLLAGFGAIGGALAVLTARRR